MYSNSDNPFTPKPDSSLTGRMIMHEVRQSYPCSDEVRKKKNWPLVLALALLAGLIGLFCFMGSLNSGQQGIAPEEKAVQSTQAK